MARGKATKSFFDKFNSHLNGLDDAGFDKIRTMIESGQKGKHINIGQDYKVPVNDGTLEMVRNVQRSRAGGTEAPSGSSSSGRGPTASERSYVNRMGSAVGDGLGFGGTTSAVARYGAGNLRREIGGDVGDVARWAGGRALRGAVAGGAIGGTVEAAQGGSFWTGAKEGAFNGAVGWTAYRAAGASFAGGSKNPAKVLGGFGNSFGLVSADAQIMGQAAQSATVGQRAQMSKSVQAIMRNRKDAGNVL